MKVLHVIPSLSPLRGGPSFALPVMAQGLVKAGVEVHIATTDDNGPGHLEVLLAHPTTERGVTTWFFRRQLRFYTFSGPLTTWLSRNVREYDLVHIHGLFSYATLPAAFYAHHYRVPYIVRPVGTLNKWGMQNRRPWLKKLSLQLLEKRVLDSAAAIHFTSEQEKKQALKLNSAATAIVVPLGIDVAPFSHVPKRTRFLDKFPHLRGSTIILFLSRLDEKKGLDILLPAFAEVYRQHPNSALVLAGSGDVTFIGSLRKQAFALGIADRIIWAGLLLGEDKLAAFAAADIFVLPSYSENFATAAVEAMSSGLPVVLSDQVGISPDVARARAGIVVACKAYQITRALLHLTSDRELRHMMGTRGQELVHRLFTIEAMTANLMKLYTRVIQQEAKDA